jgi:hypothetical protein
MQNGQLVDPDYDPYKDHIYSIFSEYFENPSLVKMRDEKQFSMWMTKIHALLGTEKRYLILFVKKDNLPEGTAKNMDSLRWESLQTRTFSQNYNLPYHRYQPRNLRELNQQIFMTENNDAFATYNTVQYPIIVTLYHSKKGNKYEYQKQGTIVNALEQFQTNVTWQI